MDAALKQLQTENQLRALFSPAEQAAYLTDSDCELAVVAGQQASEPIGGTSSDMTSDEISMKFESPVKGRLVIKGHYMAGEKHYVIKFISEFDAIDDELIKAKLTLVGDAQTGVIIAMLSKRDTQVNTQSDVKLANELVPELDWSDIQRCLKATGNETIWRLQKEGFKAFSAGLVTIPEVIYMQFKDYGDLHLKGAHKNGGDIYVFKIATGFAHNCEHNLLPTQGMMIAFNASTGAPLVVLKDEGHLTDLRTAIAGRNAAHELMPADELTGIGILGTGVQARLQIAQLQSLYPLCRKLTVWGRTQAKALAYAKEMTANGWQVTVADSPAQVADNSNLIITTTPAEVALLDADDITAANTLIIAIGADMPGKIELSPALLKKADNVLIDSTIQGKDHGNAAVAIRDGVISESDLQEFGSFLVNGLDHDAANRLRIFLSSGIGVQDLQIVQAVTESSHA